MFKSEFDMRQGSTWDESRQTQTDTVCPYCRVSCDLTVHQQKGQIVRVTSPHDHGVTHGNFASKDVLAGSLCRFSRPANQQNKPCCQFTAAIVPRVGMSIRHFGH
jgi:hypothetical protein